MRRILAGHQSAPPELAERGVWFVNILQASWDHHENVAGELPFDTGMADRLVGALIKGHDLQARGLLDKTLMVWGFEFGRTPAGRGGHVHGQTDALGRACRRSRRRHYSC